MISAEAVLGMLFHERRRMRAEFKTDFVRGVIFGLDFAIRIVQELHAKSPKIQERLPFVFKAVAMRRMLREAVVCINRSEKQKAIRLIKQVAEVPTICRRLD